MKKREISVGKGNTLKISDSIGRVAEISGPVTLVEKSDLDDKDIRTLLEMLASPKEPDFPLVEEIAARHGLYFDEYGALKAQEGGGE